jgi:WD40 repeat protein
MVGQPIHNSGFIEETTTTDLHFQLTGENPFPGLRPFTIDECHLFFGREGQSDEILLKLAQNRFVSVMGYSGSGKSSLMYCGLVPVLLGGFVTQTGPNWQVANFRPGTSPINNLVQAIVTGLLNNNKIRKEDKPIHENIINSVLRSSNKGLVEVAQYLQSEKDENIFFLIDQFEELFRYREAEDPIEAFNEAQQYVNLILEAVSQQKVPVYVAITMRSDFIGSCAVFPSLTRLINFSNYLVPQMTRDQKRLAIEGPVAVAGGKISPRLIKRVLSDVSADQDQLPIIQHAMMRTWDYWMQNHEPGEPLDIRHYNAIGKVSQALSQHANEAFEELSARDKEIAEVLFKSITERRQDTKGNRRPVKVATVAELVEAEEADVIRISNHFRQSGRSFLMPASTVTLTAESTIELSHESLMRIWNRLSNWVTEEYESAQMYKRISDAAAMYQVGKTGLWRPPDLQLALNWQKKQKPTRAWAQRYDEAFERAIVFLDSSRITYDAELKNQELQQRKQLRRARVTAIILGTATVISLLFLVFAYTQRLAANKNLEDAITQQKAAEKSAVEAKLAQNRAIEKEKQATLANEKAQNALNRLTQAISDLRAAVFSEEKAKIIAQQSLAEAKRERDSANVQRTKALTATNIANEKTEVANNLLMLAKARAMAGVSIQMEDDNVLAALLAKQAYIFNNRHFGKKYDPFIHSALYTSLTKIDGNSYNAIAVPGPARNRINSVSLSKKSNVFYVAAADGRIYKGNLDNQSLEATGIQNNYPNKSVSLSNSEKYIAVSSDSSYVQVYETDNLTKKPATVKLSSGLVYDVESVPNQDAYIVAASSGIWKLDPKTSKAIKINNSQDVIRGLLVNSNGSFAIGGTWNGSIYKIDLATGNSTLLVQEPKSKILTVELHPSDSLFAYGLEETSNNNRGLVKLISLNTGKVVRQFTGHKAGVYDIEFSPDGELMASAGSDKRLQLWVLKSPEDLPIVMDNNNGFVWDIAFAKGSDYLIATSNESQVRFWPTDPAILQNEICNKLNRNMTRYEWETYVGKDVKHEITCIGLLVEDF